MPGRRDARRYKRVEYDYAPAPRRFHAISLVAPLLTFALAAAVGLAVGRFV